MLFINCSNRERNCFKILNDIKSDSDKLISLSNKNIKFCLGCDRCSEELNHYCVLDDYITNNVLEEIVKEEDIVLACPLYMGNINAILKNLIDRFNPFYHHQLVKGKNIYLIMTGEASKEDNKNEIDNIIEYFNVISGWFHFDFEFLDYFKGYNNIEENDYENKIDIIKRKLL